MRVIWSATEHIKPQTHQAAVASLGLVSPSAVTDDVTLFIYIHIYIYIFLVTVRKTL